MRSCVSVCPSDLRNIQDSYNIRNRTCATKSSSEDLTLIRKKSFGRSRSTLKYNIKMDLTGTADCLDSSGSLRAPETRLVTTHILLLYFSCERLYVINPPLPLCLGLRLNAQYV